MAGAGRPVAAAAARPAPAGTGDDRRLGRADARAQPVRGYAALRRPGGAPGYDNQTLGQLQRDHIAFYDALRTAGHVVTNGPVRDQPDPALRGIAIYAVESVARAGQLAATDPLVQAGRLGIVAMSYLCRPGTMTSSGIPVTV